VAVWPESALNPGGKVVGGVQGEIEARRAVVGGERLVDAGGAGIRAAELGRDGVV